MGERSNYFFLNNFTGNNLKCQIDAACVKTTFSEKIQVPFYDTNTETYIDIF